MKIVNKSDRISLAHGSGGVETYELIAKLILSRVPDNFKKILNGVGIDILDDGASVPLPNGQHIVISIDAYTVNPPFFPGGDIGALAACGSINDVLMMGGKPIAMLDSIVVEEGFPVEDLEKIIESFTKILISEGIALIGGDFKVMPRGQIDGIVITSTAIGIADKLIVDRPHPGDKIVVSDFVGDHGAVIMLLQMGLKDKVEEIGKGLLRSDVKPLTKLMLPLIQKYGEYIHAARDPTRGGLAGVLNEWASKTGLVIVIDESLTPIRVNVRRYSEMLGIDPLYLASEGVAVLAIDPSLAGMIVEFMKSIGYENTRVIGEVKQSEKFKGVVVARTSVGGYRIVDPPRGELVPRIC
ncbi:MAG: hydrogenase expression/formation protein HypE [Ignisphaera sp.]|uniref:Hydrogenase expression/formation protein HypE n=1 Tax=Ignisphaera aggregans TaxID=334771 RepID=A0A7C4JIR3_9CREN